MRLGNVGEFVEFGDRQLIDVAKPPDGLPLLVIGTANSGPSEIVFVGNTSPKKMFGPRGTLYPAISAAINAGHKNIYALRIGAKNATLDYIGNEGTKVGYKVITAARDDMAGEETYIFYEGEKTRRLKVFDKDGNVLYDNNPRCTRDRDVLSRVYEGTGSCVAGVPGAGKSTLTVAGTSPGWSTDEFATGDYYVLPDTGSGGKMYKVINNTANTLVLEGTVTTASKTFRLGVRTNRCYANLRGGYGVITNISYDAGRDETTITDENAYFGGTDALVDSVNPLVLNPDVSQDTTYEIVASTETTIVVKGDATSVATTGDTYQFGYWLQKDAEGKAADGTNTTKVRNCFCDNESCPYYTLNQVETNGVYVSLTGKVKDLGSYNIGGSEPAHEDLNRRPIRLSHVKSWIASNVSGGGAYSGIMTYQAGTDGVSASKRALYIACRQALRDLEYSNIARVVLVTGVYFDEPNIIWCSRDGDALDTNDENCPWDNGASQSLRDSTAREDVLTWFVEYEHTDGRWYYGWINSIIGDVTTDITLYTADGRYSVTVGNSPSDVVAQLQGHPVDFGYLLSTFCHRCSNKNINVVGVIGARPPASFSPTAISIWLGKPPGYDADGNIIKNGRGLLGHPFHAGRISTATEVVNLPDGTTGSKDRGYFVTQNGFLDGAVVLDFLDQPVDAGKFLITVPDWVVSNDRGLLKQGLGKMSAAAVVAARISATDWDTRTVSNTAITGVSPVYVVPVDKLQLLDKAGYTALKNEGGGTLILFSDVSSAHPDSDFRLLSTLMGLMDYSAAVRQVAKRYRGMYASYEKAQAFLAEARQIVREFISKGRFESASIEIGTSTDEQARGTVVLVAAILPAFEWRETVIRVYLTPA
jgi:hypothetical protein